jgi:hypothetical protein
MRDSFYKKGDRVQIVDENSDKDGLKGTVQFVMSNGAMVRLDLEIERRYTPVQFIHLEKL